MKDFVSFSGQFLEAFVFLKGWGWFLIPLGMPEITFWHAFGLLLLSGFLKPERSEDSFEKLKDSSLKYRVICNWAAPVLVLGILKLVSLGI